MWLDQAGLSEYKGKVASPTGKTRPIDVSAGFGGFGATFAAPSDTGDVSKPSPGKQAAPKENILEQMLLSYANMPLDSYRSLDTFGAAGGFTPILSAISGGNPFVMAGAKILQSLFKPEQRLPIEKPGHVIVDNFKDAFKDVFTLTNTRMSFSDTFGRRQLTARPMIKPSGARA